MIVISPVTDPFIRGEPVNLIRVAELKGETINKEQLNHAGPALGFLNASGCRARPPGIFKTLQPAAGSTLTSLLRVCLTRSLKPFVFEKKPPDKLDLADLQNLGLYVHIPFCRSLCSFCPYCKVLFNRELANRYVIGLIKEIKLVGSQCKAKKKVTSLYFGGGTPALIAGSLGKIIETLQDYFEISEGIGIELHPDDIASPTLEIIKAAGISMVSIGIQSFNRHSLDVLGRQESDHADKLKQVVKYGFPVVDADLIFALPGQTAEMLIADIETAFACGATQVSTYPFIDFRFTSNQCHPLPERDKMSMLGKITAYCRDNEIERTSVWTFARTGSSKYSSVTRESFLGFGASAATLLKAEFRVNTFSVDAYLNRIEEKRLPTALTLSFTQRQRAAYFLFWSIYGMEIRQDLFNAFFADRLDRLFGFELWLAKIAGLLKKHDDHYRLTDRGASCFHLVEQAYTHAYISKMWQIAMVNPFPEKIALR